MRATSCPRSHLLRKSTDPESPLTAGVVELEVEDEEEEELEEEEDEADEFLDSSSGTLSPKAWEDAAEASEPADSDPEGTLDMRLTKVRCEGGEQFKS